MPVSQEAIVRCKAGEAISGNFDNLKQKLTTREFEALIAALNGSVTYHCDLHCLPDSAIAAILADESGTAEEEIFTLGCVLKKGKEAADIFQEVKEDVIKGPLKYFLGGPKQVM